MKEFELFTENEDIFEDDNVYDEDVRESMLDNDELSGEEAAFIQGYEEDGQEGTFIQGQDEDGRFDEAQET
ncbi:MAG: hypothetical protein ABIH34_06720 [Nanoarchaeota archaeon]